VPELDELIFGEVDFAVLGVGALYFFVNGAGRAGAFGVTLILQKEFPFEGESSGGGCDGPAPFLISGLDAPPHADARGRTSSGALFAAIFGFATGAL
jgi:hypothetical protein